MEFSEFKPVAYLESETSCLFLESPEEIAACQRILGARTPHWARDNPGSCLPPWQPSSTRIERTNLTAPESDSIVWRTCGYSAGSDDYVQVAPVSDRVLVRDFKNLDGPTPAVPTPA